MSEPAWVKLKVFGFLPLTIIFMLLQGGLIKRYSIEPEESEPGGEGEAEESADCRPDL